MNLLLVKLLACLVFGVIVVFTLYTLYSFSNKENGFSRDIKRGIVEQIAVKESKHDGYYLAGMCDSGIFIANYYLSEEIQRMNFGLEVVDSFKVHVSDSIKIAWKAVKIFVEYPDVYLVEGIEPSIITCRLPNLDCFSINYSAPKFESAVPVSKSSIVMRKYSTRVNRNILAKKNAFESSTYENESLLSIQGGGNFSIDGMLRYDNGSNELAYIYYYRNEYLCLDTNLNLVRIGKTIDTIRNAQIAIDTIKGENRVTFTKPPKFVNKLSCVSDGYLYINSALKGDNESKSVFLDNSVVDVYSLAEGKYVLSFYLPNYKGHGLRDFKVHNKILTGFFGNYLIEYGLSF
ncbi:hypothetical protein [Chitinophaga sp.]|uniref:hypothetical protein n=1 Tax=Chitinophaga sp. TaxID=1869181 RepID=UPI0031D29B7E